MTRPVRILIAGAGRGGTYAAKELRMTHPKNVEIIGFVDDNVSLIGKSIEGIQVIGGTYDIPQLAQKHDIDEAIIAMPSVDGAVIKRIQLICDTAGIGCRVIPGIYDVLTGLAAPQTIREVRFEDLIKRPPAIVDQTGIKSYLKDRVVLVTGAGGSIGSEIARQISNLQPKKLLLLDRAENSLTELLWDLEMSHQSKNAQVLIADINDERKLKRVFLQHKPNVVYHAAAFKHVYLMEDFPEEAVRNNIIASEILFRTAVDTGVERLIAISTDKAVNPTSVMGATKRVMELIVKEYAKKQSGTKFSAVRFGNVFNSEGSVVKLFQKQIEKGGPLTITHPDAERFFMSVTEAAQLVIQAGAFADSGSIYILDMGQPVRIYDIASEMCRLRGHTIEETIDVVYSGLRLGEKMTEVLINQQETMENTKNERVKRVVDLRNRLNNLDETLELLRALVADCNREELIDSLQKIVPEFRKE